MPPGGNARRWLWPCLAVVQFLALAHLLRVRCGPSLRMDGDDAPPQQRIVSKLPRPSSAAMPNDGIRSVLVTTKTDPPFHMFVFDGGTDRYISKRIASAGVYEPDTTDLMYTLLPDRNGDGTDSSASDTMGFGRICDDGDGADIVLDLGSNLGYYSLLAAARGYRVISFEASPDTAWLQRSSAALNRFLVDESTYDGDIAADGGSLVLIDKGVSDAPTTGRLSRHAHSPGMTSFAAAEETAFDLKEAEAGSGAALDAEIELVRAGDVLSDLNVGANGECLRLLKIDVEGYELKALRGLDLERYPFETIVMEYFPAMLRAAGTEPMELLREIASRGYEFWQIRKGGSLTEIEIDSGEMERKARENDNYHVNLLARRIKLLQSSCHC